MTTETLTSLAMLMVNIDQGKDYLDYLRPFILQILVDQKPDPITDRTIHDSFRICFGLEIPERAIQIVLKRLARNHPLKKKDGVYRIVGPLKSPGIDVEKSRAERHIIAVISGLIDFSKNTAKPISTRTDAKTALMAFLSQFNILCLKAFLRGTTIPTLAKQDSSQIILVSDYVLNLQQTDPERFESFMVLVQGHMLANALLCPDLQKVPKTYKNVTFYLDTPLLVRRLGLEGEIKKAALENLINLLHNLGATVAVFSHSRDELEGVIKGAADHVDDFSGRGSIVTEARRKGTTKSDLLLLAGQIDNKLQDAKIVVNDTPEYIEDYQIDRSMFEQVLDDEVSYFNPRAKDYDINSVRSIYVLRAGTTSFTIEHCKVILVTSNSGFAWAAFEYGQQHELSCDVSSVISDFSLANIAWLKAPLGAPSLPAIEVLAFSYAALQPTSEFLSKFLLKIEKLEKEGKITARDHQLLRSSTLAQRELMHLTMGDDDALTEESVIETLSRVTSEIKKEEREKLQTEQNAHRETQEILARELSEKKQFQERLYWRCRRRAKLYSWGVAVIIGLLLLSGIVTGFGLKSANPTLGWILLLGSVLVGIAETIDLMVGFSVHGIREKLENRLLTYFLKKESTATGLELDEVQL